MGEFENRPGVYEIDAGAQRVMIKTVPLIPNPELITRALTTALATQFDLGPAYSTEGGLDGLYKGDRIDLTNISDGRRRIGLWNESYSWRYPKAPGEGLQEILDMYKSMLVDLFGGHHGEILVDRPFNASEQVAQALLGMLECTGGTDLRRRVMQNTDALVPLKEAMRLMERLIAEKSKPGNLS